MTRHLRRRGLAALLSAAVLVLAPAATANAQDDGAEVVGADQVNAIPDQYIVVVKAHGNARAVAAEARSNGATVHFEYSAALNGFAATLPAQALEGVRHNPNVEYIEADQTMSIDADQPNPPSWGLDRIDQRNLPLNSNYHYDFTGSGVKAYIIDTGIRRTHTTFGGRAIAGTDTVGDGQNGNDCNGHGTHVAGTVGGTSYGVAKAVTLVTVRVLNCQGSGSNSGVIAGIDWVTSNHAAGQSAVANMSLGGGASSSLDAAVNNSIADGVTYAIAAGNSNANACNYSPARVAAAITVGATTSTDARASYSNYGTCLDIFAPGSGITSAWNTSDTATNTISGTSMATPHVAGAAALYLQANPSSSPSAVRDAIVNNATTGVVTSPGTGSPNRLLYTLFGAAPPPPPPPPPSGCSSYPEVYSGSLSGTGDADIHPNGTYFQITSARTLIGCLDGPTGVDFDLALYRWNGFSWSRVAVSQSTGPDENITYSASAGYYYWRVYSYSGSGSYTFGMQR